MAKTRKWSNLEGVLPEDPKSNEAGPFMDKVWKEVDAREGKPFADISAEWESLNDAGDEAKRIASERNVRYRALEIIMLRRLKQQKEETGHDSWRGRDMLYSPQFELEVLVTDEDAYMKWIKETGQEHMLRMPRSKTEEIVKDALSTELAAMLTADQRASLKPGEPASGACPPGIEVYLRKKIHDTDRRKKTEPEGSSSPTTDSTTGDSE
jgi:hypothetical protein